MSEYSTNDAREPNAEIDSADLTYALEDDERPSEAVVRSVASLTDTAILELEPLYSVMDPDQLNGLFEATRDNDCLESSVVTFRFNGCRVTVTADTVHVNEFTDTAQ